MLMSAETLIDLFSEARAETGMFCVVLLAALSLLSVGSAQADNKMRINGGNISHLSDCMPDILSEGICHVTDCLCLLLFFMRSLSQ